jgi:hypothetical protein
MIHQPFIDVPIGKVSRNPLTVSHLRQALLRQKSSVSKDSLAEYEAWTANYGENGSAI